MYDPILLTLDGSALAERALPNAIELAKGVQAKLIVLRVVPPLLLPTEYPFGYGDLSGYQRILDAEQSDAEGYLAQLKERLLAENPTLQLEVQTRFGNPPEVILDAITELNAKLLVMATHGRSGMSRWVFGSVADRVLHAAQIPMLMIRVGETAEAEKKP